MILGDIPVDPMKHVDMLLVQAHYFGEITDH